MVRIKNTKKTHRQAEKNVKEALSKKSCEQSKKSIEKAYDEILKKAGVEKL